MVDLHCHILPALDDGARDLEDSVGMARQAQEDGIALICATPHIRHDHDVNIDELAPRVAALEVELVRRDLPVRVVAGGEVAQSAAEALSAETLRRVSLGGGGWLLLEPAPGPLAGELERLVERLHGEGLRTVIAHPERHAGEDFEERLAALTALGCLIQWTAAFVARAAPGDLVLRLAREGLVDLLGSDSHSSRAGRPVRLSGAVERLREVCDAERVGWIAETGPWAVVRGEPAKAPWR